MPRAHEISVYLVGSEKHRAWPDLSDNSGFWLRVKAEDAPRSSRLPKLRRQRSVAYVSDEGMGIVFSASRDRRSSSSGRVAGPTN